MNPFSTFSITPSLSIDLEQLKETYQNLAAQHHPDNGGNKANFEKLNEDYQTLLRPSKRLLAFMEAESIEYDSRGSVSNKLMDLFMKVGSQIQNTDAFLKKKEAATSTLAKALLEGETLATQDEISNLIESIEFAQEHIYESLEQSPEATSLPQHARDLAFLEKWQAQLKQRYAQLF